MWQPPTRASQADRARTELFRPAGKTAAGEETLHSGSAAAVGISSVTNLQRHSYQVAHHTGPAPQPSASAATHCHRAGGHRGPGSLPLGSLAQRASRNDGCGSEAKRAACPTPNCLESAAARASLTNSSLGSVAGGLRSCDVGSSEDLAVSTHSFASLTAFWYVVLRCVVGRTCVGHGWRGTRLAWDTIGVGYGWRGTRFAARVAYA